MKFHDHALRGESELTVGEREMIAAYVSALNSCGFCHGTHAAVAELHGIEATLLEKLIENLTKTEVEEAPKQPKTMKEAPPVVKKGGGFVNAWR